LKRSPGPGWALSGLALLNKPSGITSHDLVALTRKALGTREAGHLGTLDPLASGLMGVLVGPATKLAPYLAGHRKSYFGEFVLGLMSDTLDVTGRIEGGAEGSEGAEGSGGAKADEGSGEAEGAGGPDSLGGGGAARGGPLAGQKAASGGRRGEGPDPFSAPPPVGLSEGQIRAAMARLTGDLLQEPPVYSAIKVGGSPSFRLARKGRPPSLPPRPVTVWSLGLSWFRDPVAGFEAEVSAGCYIRSLGRDLGRALGLPGAVLKSLTRSGIGPWTLEAALAPPFSREDLERSLISPRGALAGLPEYLASESDAELLRRGGFLKGGALDLGRLRVFGGSGPGAPAGAPAGAGPGSSLPALPLGPVRLVAPDGSLIGVGEFGGGGLAPNGGAPGAPEGEKELLSARPFLRPRRILQA
jgi:tRNA pseudouridine55 synthase